MRAASRRNALGQPTDTTARKLLVLSGAVKGASWPLTEDSIAIGRDEDNPIRLPGQFISRHHALLVRAGGEYILRDLNSSNGTFLNDQPIRETLLKPGDRIRIGGIEMRYEVAPAPAQPQSEELAGLRSRLAATQQQLAEAQSLAGARATEMESARRASAAAEQESAARLKELAQQIDTLTSDLAGARKQAGELAAQLACEKQQAAEQLAGARAQAEAQTRDRQQRIEKLTQECERLTGQLRAANDALKTAEAELEKLPLAQQRVQELSQRNEQLSRANEQKATELEMATNKVHSLMAELKQLGASLAQARQEATTQNQQNRSLASELAAAKKQWTALQRESQEQSAAIEQAAADQLAKLQAERDEALRQAGKATELTMQNTHLLLEMSALRLHVAEMERAGAERESAEVQRLETELAEARSAAQRLALLAGVGARSQAAQAQEAELARRSRELAGKLVSVETVLGQIRFAAEAEQPVGLQQLQVELGKTRAELERIADLQTRMDQLTRQNADLVAALAKAHEEINVARRRLSAMTAEQFKRLRQDMSTKAGAGPVPTGLSRQLGAVRRALRLF